MSPVTAPPRRRRRWPAVVVLVAVVAWFGVGLTAAHLATAPLPAVLPPPDPDFGDVEEVSTRTVDGVTVRGWFVAGRESASCVVLAAGIRGNRARMQGRARFWLDRGGSVLLVDLRGTGASDPVRIAMGWHEALDLLAWHAFLRARGVARIGVHGQSLGAAAAVFTAVRGAPDWEFVVLEACYTNVREALAARLPWLPAFALWPMVAGAEWLLDADIDDLDAERAITRLTAPTLLVQGDVDAKVGPNAKDRLFAASSAVRKARCDVPKAGHVDLWAAGGRVQAAIVAFLHPR